MRTLLRSALILSIVTLFELSIVSEYANAQSTYDMALGYRRVFNSDWTGFNGSNMIRDSLGWSNPKLIGNLPNLNPKNLRYPAGGTANWWNWRIGWFVNRPDLPSSFSGLPPKYSKLETFKVSVDSTHANAIFVVNMLTSSLHEQIAMLKHADSIGIPVKYVELGSEFYLDGGEDSVLIVTEYPTAADYADTASHWADSIHHYFPLAKVCAQGAFNRNNAVRRNTWDEVMFPTLHGEDAISYHTYMSVDDYADSATISYAFYPSDVPVMMGRPFKMWNILTSEDFPLIPAGKEIWITEYNMRDHTKPVQGCWGQALFVATQSMQFLNDTRITHLACHAMCGSAVAGAYFNTIHGFDYGSDGNFTAPANPPSSTQYWGLTSTGFGVQELGLAVKDGLYASPLEFKYIPSTTVFDGIDTFKYPNVYGWAIVKNNSTQALIVNLTANNVSIKTAYVFPAGGTYSDYYADPMLFVAKNSDVTHDVSSTLPSTLVLKPYSITRITGSSVPAAPPTVSLTATGNTTFCLGDSVLLDAGLGYVEYRWSTGDSTRTIWAKQDGDYWVHARSVINGYWGGDTMHVTVHQPPAVPVINNMPSHSFCHGDSLVASVKFPDGSLTYSWSNGQPGTSLAVKAGGSYTVTATNNFGCYATSTPVAFTENALPTPTIVALGPTEFCYDQSVVLSVTSTYNSYNWSTGNVGQTRTITASGSYSCTVTDNNGCKGTSNVITTTVHSVPLPIATTSSGTTTFCSNAGVYLTTSTTGFNYQWQQGGTNINGATNQNYSPVSTGNYRVVLSDAFSCTNRSDALNLTINAPPAPSITGISTICQGQTSTFSVTNPYSSYLWSTGATTSSITVSDAGTYTVTLIDVNGCVGTSAPKTLTVNPLPTPTITAGGPTEFCSGGNVVLSVTQAYDHYNWSSGQVGQSRTINASGNYSCTVTDANGCTGTSNSISVNVHTLPVPDVQTSNGLLNFCSNVGAYVYTTVTGYNYQWQQGGVNITGATNSSFIPTASGNYRVQISDAFGCTMNSAALTLTLYAPPAPNITGGSSFCQGSSLTLTVNSGYSSYLWSTGATTNTTTVTAGGTYTVTLIDVNGCVGSSSKSVTMNASPTPTISASGATEFCSGGSVTLTVNQTYNSYNWSNGNVGQSKSFTSSGNYSCTVTDANGCTGTSNVISVNVHTLPTPDINTSTGATTFCANAGIYLTTSVTGYNYNWQQGGTNISGATNQTYTPTASGAYRIKITDGLGCTARSNAMNLTLNSPPAPNITGATTICQGSNSTLGTSLAYSTYLWTGGATTSTLVVSAAGTYTVTVTDANGCSGSSSKTVSTFATPTPTITSNGAATEFCSGGSVTLNVTTVYNSYNWSNGTHGQSQSFNSSGTYSCTVTDANGCTGTSNSIAVNVHTLPTPDINTSTGATTFCASAGVYLTTTTTGYSYQWQQGGINITGATNQNYTPTANGTYRVQISDAFGCTARSNSLTLTVNASPTVTVTGPSSICSGSSATLGTSVSYLTYLWSTGETTATINVSASGTYTVTVTDGSSCPGVGSKTVNFFTPPSPTITAGSATEFCSGGSVTLSVSSTYNSYSWTNGGTAQSKTYSASGTYSCTVTDANGCTGTSNSIAVNVHTLPTPSIATSTGATTFCSNSGVYLTTTTTGYSYQWTQGGTNIAGATSQNYTPTSGGNYKVQIADNFGCTTLSSSLIVTINTAPAPSISGTGNMCSGQSISLSPTLTYSSYLWSTGATTQSITVSSPGTYTVTVTDLNGCTGVTSKTTQLGATLSPTITASGPTEFCSGSVNLSTSTTYSHYSWSNGKTTQTVTIKATGTYSCTVTDVSGCTGISNSISVNAHELPTVPIASSTGATTFCSNSGVYLYTTVTGYNYTWFKGTAVVGANSSNYTPTASATYKVQISDAFGCTAKSTGLAVTVNTAPVPSITGSTSVCSGNSTTLSANTTYSQYAWSTGANTQSISVNTGGTYTLTVTDANSCTGTASATATVYSSPTATITASGPTEFCDGASVDLTASANTSYSWSNGKTTQTVTIKTSGSYTVTVTDSHGCTAVSAPVTVTDHVLPDPTITLTGPATYCKNTPSTLSTIPGYSYQWKKGTVIQDGATNQTYQPSKTGTYKVTINDAFGCTKTSATGVAVTVNSCKEFDEADASVSSMNLYPNPAYSGIHIDAQFASKQSGEAVMEIYNMLGQMIYREEQDVVNGKFSTNIKFDQRFAEGSYLARVMLNNELVKQQFIVTDSQK